jgi:hypothetical protein
MSTHSALGVKLSDGTIVGCYVHYDGSTMLNRVNDFIEKYTATALVTLIIKAQKYGGIRSFHSPSDYMDYNSKPETDFLDDGESYAINEANWNNDLYGVPYSYLVDYSTGEVECWKKYDD